VKLATLALKGFWEITQNPFKAKEIFAETKKEMQDVLAESKSVIQNEKAKFKESANTLTKYMGKLHEAREAIAKNTGERVKYGKGLNDNTDDLNDNNDAMGDAAAAAEKMKEQLALVGSTTAQISEKFADLQTGIQLMTHDSDAWGSALEKLNDKELVRVVQYLEELIASGKATDEVFQAYSAVMQEAANRSDHLAGQVGFATKKVDDNQETVKEATGEWSTWAEVIDAAASSLIDMGFSADSGFGQIISGAANAAMSMQDFTRTLSADKINMAGLITSGMSVLGSAAQVLEGVLGGKENWEKVADEVADAFGVALSEGLSQTIAETSAQVAGIPEQILGTFLEGAIDETDRYTASLIHLGDIMGEGLESGFANVGDYKQGIADLYNEIESGAISASMGLQALGDVWDQLSAQAAQGSIQAQQMMAQMMQAAEATGQIPAQMAEAMEAGIDQMIAGLEQVLGGLTTVGEAQGDLFASAFWGAVGSKGLLAASDAMKASWETLSEKGGPDLTGAMGQVGRLMELTQSNEQFRGAAQAGQGLSEMVQGMAAANMITAESFAALGQTAQQAFEQAVSGGATEAEAITAILPYLAQAQQAAAMYGVELDANTQALIDQAEAAGYSFPADPMMVMVDLLREIAVVLGAEIPESANQAAEAVSKSSEKMGEAAEKMGKQTKGMGAFDALEQDATAAIEQIQNKLLALQSQKLSIPFELSGNLEPGKMGGFAKTKKKGAVTAAAGYGPVKLSRDTIIQAHAGEHVLVVPKGRPFAARSAQGGMGVNPYESGEAFESPDPYESGEAFGGGDPYESGAAFSGGNEAAAAVNTLSESVENLTESLEALAQQPQISAQVALTPNINISQAQGQDAISLSNEIARELRANSVPGLKRAIRDISEGRI
jgi:hypothetical protein